MRFSRNFGFQSSILANYLHARGDAVMQIDADLQDPPEMLEQFFASVAAGLPCGLRHPAQATGRRG